MNENIVNLLLQIPLAGVVVLVVILFLRHMKELTSAFMIALSNQQTLYMDALRVQREENNAVTKELVEATQKFSDVVNNRLDEMALARAKADAKRK